MAHLPQPQKFDRPQHSRFPLIRKMVDDMERLFAGTRASTISELFSRDVLVTGWNPQIDVFERNNKLIVRADLPGLSTGDVGVELVDEGLLIEGERRTENVENDRGIYRSERSHGSFRRLIEL